MKFLLTILILLVFSEIAPRARAQDDSNQKPAKRNTTYDEIAEAPGKARAKRNPLESDADAIAAGRVLFEQHCQECHGRSAEGAKRDRAFAHRRFRVPSQGRSFGF